MSPSPSAKCSHTIYLSVCKDQVIGIHPKLAESALTNNCLSVLQNVKSYRRETKIHIPD